MYYQTNVFLKAMKELEKPLFSDVIRYSLSHKARVKRIKRKARR